MFCKKVLRDRRLRGILDTVKHKKISPVQSRSLSLARKLSTQTRSKNILKSSSLLAGGSVLAALLSLSALDFSDGDIPVKEVMLHNNVNDCWIVLNGEIYDVTSFIGKHPGGAARLLEVAGRDATAKFLQVHSQEVLDRMKNHLIYIGKLKGRFELVVSEEELRIEEMKAKIPPIERIFNLSDFEAIAKQVLPKSTFTFYATGSSDEFTLRENHYAYSRIFFKPRILQDIDPSEVDCSTTLLGAKVDAPFYISGFAGSKLAHPLGERNLQIAAYNANVMEMVPKQNSYGPEEFYSTVPDDQSQWMQYHFSTPEEVLNFDKVVREAESRPSVKGIFFNVDLADIGNREKDSRRRVMDADNISDLNAIVNNRMGNHPKFSWKDVEKIVSSTNLPIALKGVQRGEDVVMAAKKGVKAVVLSNHGGRQLDFSRPPLEVLAEANEMLKKQNMQGDIEIYLDGGVRRGSDIVKALCLGAKGVGLGRPFLYAMAGYGEEGVDHLITILKEEIKNNMRLLGVTKIEELNESFVDYNSLKFRVPKANDSLYDNAYMPLTFPEFK
ncbi:ZYRO0C18524p [Zygosaccharomyces rouxii]|uniref:ZYRO0C18524p n=1 Tax=Zygosaccharomyces rouxii (strain ATCC 2623 / CBS 732 / NBRC 1130 / NCYC 568 / NRRL Y-229) TaxID=559307 RepID=C5DUP4_ZYGRC|nr:uncharacterized protein ZYRO0C18524g [Zygosaccharomyces rouxii]KAH9199718.1 FMN-dependent dehydrogenase-domain-containing protein [Zygosaccharomyces rouxii]CAR27505.1 ZYRO0C18524p [Zygosaccharomyces rouxii]